MSSQPGEIQIFLIAAIGLIISLGIVTLLILSFINAII